MDTCSAKQVQNLSHNEETATESAWTLELLQCLWQQPYVEGILPQGMQDSVQVVRPAKSAQELQLERVQ